jgi:hypothetical protein
MLERRNGRLFTGFAPNFLYDFYFSWLFLFRQPIFFFDLYLKEMVELGLASVDGLAFLTLARAPNPKPGGFSRTSWRWVLSHFRDPMFLLKAQLHNFGMKW